MNKHIETIKKHHRQNLATLPFDLKIAMLINMQKIAREMALASGRPFKGTVWCEKQYVHPTEKRNRIEAIRDKPILGNEERYRLFKKD